ncbi:cytochrome c oxidase subunit II [Sphingosinicella sp. BN140058]|uniref:cytochrome c oxidase subunit II n=1 Tax=Sphingosinicella sp. BN140058 TaxID=1892855 RepID=UPI00101371CE|nr:cytochrome c oxidase subunit II [Sphingosinicella sp. BN140058]QAY76674.1 cytochrome c oxidase subunit II [Sphingosinicella sp. BN140058]
MKTSLKLFAVAAAFGMAPASAFAQQAPAAPAPTAAPAAAAAAPAQQPIDAVSANSQAAPAQPSEISLANTSSEEPSNASVLSSSVTRTLPDATVGQPTGELGFQPQVTPIGEEASSFHNYILLPLITVISVFVLLLLLYVVVRFRRSANPVPSRTTHNTVLEIAWTLVPVLILVAIAVPSIRLLAHQYSPPKADLTIKATGNQWYWTYTYPDNGDFEIVSNVLKDEDAKKRGEPRLLAVDERMVVPVGATVKMIVTSADVIHSWGVPAFWAKIDAVPGRLNETWFKTDRPGVYYGQCFELCGARHAYMPIAVEVVTPAQFAAWVASKGGTMPGAAQAKSGDETATSPVTNPAAAAAAAGPVPTGGGSATETSPEPTGLNPATGTPAVSTQGATESKRGN